MGLQVAERDMVSANMGLECVEAIIFLKHIPIFE